MCSQDMEGVCFFFFFSSTFIKTKVKIQYYTSNRCIQNCSMNKYQWEGLLGMPVEVSSAQIQFYPDSGDWIWSGGRFLFWKTQNLRKSCKSKEMNTKSLSHLSIVNHLLHLLSLSLMTFFFLSFLQITDIVVILDS